MSSLTNCNECYEQLQQIQNELNEAITQYDDLLQDYEQLLANYNIAQSRDLYITSSIFGQRDVQLDLFNKPAGYGIGTSNNLGTTLTPGVQINGNYGYRITFPANLTAYIKITCILRKFSSGADNVNTHVGQITGNIEGIYEYSGSDTGTDCSSPPITSYVHWNQHSFSTTTMNAIKIITLKVTAGSNNSIFLYGTQNTATVQAMTEIAAYNGYNKGTCDRNQFKNSVTNVITSQTIWSTY